MDSYQGRPQTAPRDQYKFSLEYDFRKIDVDSLGRVFGIDCWQVEDLISESACEIDPIFQVCMILVAGKLSEILTRL